MDGWKPIYHWARGEYERIRGDFPAARRELESALDLMPEEGHIAWADAAGAHLRTLLALGHHEEACALGLEYLQKADAMNSGHWSNAIAMPLALAHAHAHDAEKATALADRVIDYYRELRSTGLNPFLAHETRARVAAILRDDDGLQRHLDLCLAQIPAGSSGALTAKYERLVHDTTPSEEAVPGSIGRASSSKLSLAHTTLLSLMSSELAANVRAHKSLERLLEASGAREGYLFVVGEEELISVARIATRDVPDKVMQLAERIVLAELSDDDTTTQGGDADSGTSEIQNGLVYRPIIIGHHLAHCFDITGVAILAAEVSQPFRYPNEVAREVADVLGLHGGSMSRPSTL